MNTSSFSSKFTDISYKDNYLKDILTKKVTFLKYTHYQMQYILLLFVLLTIFSLFVYELYSNFYYKPVITSKKTKSNIILIVFLILLLIVIITILINLSFESVIIDIKQGVIKYKSVSFLRSNSFDFFISSIKSIYMIQKGYAYQSNDSSRYYIKISYEENKEFIFGETLSISRIYSKYREIIAIIYGTYINSSDKNLIVNEVISNIDYGVESEKKL